MTAPILRNEYGQYQRVFGFSRIAKHVKRLRFIVAVATPRIVLTSPALVFVLLLFCVHQRAGAQSPSDPASGATLSTVRKQALKAAVESELAAELHISVETPLDVIEIKSVGNWALGIAIETPREGSNGAPATYLFVSRQSPRGDEVAVSYTSKFRAWVSEAPNDLFPPEARLIYGSDQPQADGSAQLSLPWLAGGRFRLTQGPHDNGVWSSLDFGPPTPGDTIPVYASRGGVAYKITPPLQYPNACQVVIDHPGPEGWQTSYYHLKNITVATSGTSVSTGSLLGYTSCVVCSANASCSGPHVHWSLRRANVYQPLDGVCIGGWVIHAGSTKGGGSMTKGAVTVIPSTDGIGPCGVTGTNCVESDGSAGCAPATTIRTVSKGNGVFVPHASVTLNGVTAGSTDSVGQLVLPTVPCGNVFLEAKVGALHFLGFVDFQCSDSNGNTVLDDKRTATVNGTANEPYVLEMESDGSCAPAINNFVLGDVVEVFATGNGLRARYPDPCSDSYAVMPDLSVGTIVGAAQCCNGYTRWKIRYDGLAGIDVWSAEGEPSTGQMFLRKKQSSTCSYSLAPARLDLDTFGGAAGGFNVTAGSSCYWTAIANQNWISITTNASGNGAKQVTFSVEANNGSVSRSGAITVADQIFTITQPGTAGPTPTPSSTPGALALSTNNIFVGKQDGGGTILVYNKDSGVINWTASTSTPWLTLLTPYGTATGNGTSLSFNHDQNTGGPQRIGTITVTSPGATGSPQTLTVTQGGSDGASITISDIFSPSTVNAGEGNVAISWKETSPISQQVLFLLSLYPTGQTGIRYDIKHDFFYLTVPGGSSRCSVGFDFPVNMYSGLYDVEISLWSDKNGDGKISSADTLLGIDKKTGATHVNGTQPPIPVLHVSTNAITVGSGSGGANLLVSNTGDGVLNWSASSDESWITVETPSGSSSAGSDASLGFSFQQNNGTIPRTGTVNVVASDATGNPQSITIAQPATAFPVQLGNISTRLKVATGDNVLIGGFIITGTQPKAVIVRGIGSSLALADRLADPTLELRDSTGALLDSNDNWADSPSKQVIIARGVAPVSDLEAAIVATLPANGSSYTAILRGSNNGTGIGVVEAYDLDQSVDSKLANISTRGFVDTGDNVMIGGIIITGNIAAKVLFRAIGPSLINVPDALQDPTLELHDSQGGLVMSNDNWRETQEAAIIGTTIPPTDNRESSILATLQPGQYTAIVRGKDNSTGVAVVEAYQLQ